MMFKRFWIFSRVSAALTVGLALLACTSAGCHHEVDRPGAYAATDAKDCLPDLTLIDQNGKNVSLASLKGKPVLFDFIYTTCPGPCLTLTSRMRVVANQLGTQLGSKVWFVSVTVDPEHDGPAQLRDYAKAQGVDKNGWLFLTGPPADVERLMAQFNLLRQREADGSVDHVLEFFLVGPDGRQLYQYLGTRADPTAIARDVEQAVQTGRLANSEEPSTQAHL
jgi:cytochrome oxidase Cu insertion factor (SCO1/SenC/PrrC family)